MDRRELMCTGSRRATPTTLRGRLAFTLVELLVVIGICPVDLGTPPRPKQSPSRRRDRDVSGEPAKLGTGDGHVRESE